jgi:hypothetical protein
LICYVRRALLDIWELGRHLLETREQYGHRLWGRYLHAIGVDDSSAAQYMDLAFKYPARETLRDSGHQTLKAALADGGPSRPRRPKRAALPAGDPPAQPTEEPDSTVDITPREMLTRTVAEVLALADTRADLSMLDQSPERDDPDWADTVETQERPEGWRAAWQDLLRFDAVDWAEVALEHLLKQMGQEWLIEQAMRLCGPYTELTSDAPAMVIDLHERRASKTTQPDPDAMRDDLALVLQALQLADSVQDLRHRGGTCKLVGDRDHLRPFVEGPLSGYGFRWKEAKGRRHGCYWTDHGKLSLPKQGRPAGRGDQGT